MGKKPGRSRYGTVQLPWKRPAAVDSSSFTSFTALRELGGGKLIRPHHIRVLIADEETLVRRALESFVNGADDMSVVGEARTGGIAVHLHAQLKPDVVIVSLVEGEDGVETIRRIRETDPGARVLALTNSGSGATGVTTSAGCTVMALRAGTRGFVMRDEEPEALLSRIREVHGGDTVLSQSATLDLIAFVLAVPEKTNFDALSADEHLSDLELSVVRLLAQGMSNAEIAQGLHLSEAGVKMRLAKIMAKWGSRTRLHVLIRAVRVGLVELSQPPLTLMY
ncbi:response regulator [Cryobacterium lyxosi]|uniref:Response regulator transcription factor n=1 Tax=Cryobacterium lyxosi TaxID=1259228 RepID=A0A4R8ZJW2_9MICO|nr:response regulator transcription factor [Cryobacterium lyxosi]TFD28542.1 response regulator transcription factor [Cryobacterium lyxosi]